MGSLRTRGIRPHLRGVLFWKVLEPALHVAVDGSLTPSSSPPLAQGAQAKLQNQQNTESGTLWSQYSGMSLNMMNERPKSANSLGSQSGISMQSGLTNQTSDLGTVQKVRKNHVSCHVMFCASSTGRSALFNGACPSVS